MKKLPKFKSDKAAEKFTAEADLATYDLSELKPHRFEFAPKTARVNMRLPEALLAALKKRAKREGIPYQRLMSPEHGSLRRSLCGIFCGNARAPCAPYACCRLENAFTQSHRNQSCGPPLGALQ